MNKDAKKREKKLDDVNGAWEYVGGFNLQHFIYVYDDENPPEVCLICGGEINWLGSSTFCPTCKVTWNVRRIRKENGQIIKD